MTTNGKSIQEAFNDDPNAGNDSAAPFTVPVDLGDGRVVGYSSEQLAGAVAETLGLGENISDPSAFSMTLQSGTLLATIAPLTGHIYTYYVIQKDSAVVPTGGGIQGTVPAQYPVDTGWDADTLQPHTFSLFISTNDINFVEVGPAQTVTATTTSVVPQTPNDVNFPSLTGAVKNTTVGSNKVSISGLLAPTAITIVNGTYSKNDGTAISTAGVIENGDTIQLFVDLPNADSTPKTVTVQLGLRPESWTVTTAATGVVAGVISIVDAVYSGAENSTITINLAVTGRVGSVEVGCRVSTQFIQDYHKAQDGINYIKIESQVVTFAAGDDAESITITNIPAGLTLNVAGELIIEQGSEFGGATIDPDLDATLFYVNALAAGDAFDIFLGDTGTKWMGKVNLRDAVDLSRATNTPGGGLTWTPIESPAVAFQSTPLSHASTAEEDTTAELSFDVDITQAGSYFFHLKAAGPHFSQNQCRISVDGGAKKNYGVNDNDGVYAWGNNGTYNTYFTMDVGVHTITFHNYENTFGIEEVLFVLSSVYAWNINAEGEAYSTYPTSAGGADPANPLIPLGPPNVIDDKTPDPFPFGEIVDQLLNPSETTAYVESQPVSILGINVPTEIAITDDPTGTGEYSLDGGSTWINAAAAVGSITVGQEIIAHLKSASTNSTAATMDVTVGTVTHTFTSTTKSSGFIVLTPRTTMYTISTNNEDIQDWDVQVANGDGLIIAPGVTGTKIRGNRISTPNGHAISNNNRGPIEDALIHNNDIMNCWGSGVYFYGFVSVNIYDNNFENLHTGVDLWQGKQGGIIVSGNWMKNMFHRVGGVASANGNGVALRGCSGPGIEIDTNIIINIPGKNTIEDKINIYRSSGTAASPMHLHHNKMNGKNESFSDSTIIVGDQGGSYTLVEDNIMVNAGQTGCGMNDGHDHVYRRNKMLCVPLYALSDPSIGVSNVGFAPGFTPDSVTVPTYGNVFEDNDVTVWKAANYAGRGGEEFLQPYWFRDQSFFGPGDIAGWSTNRFDTSDSQPAGLTEAGLWLPEWNDKPQRLA